MRLFAIALTALPLLLGAAPISDHQAAATLQHTFESRYLELSGAARQHYSLRLYRLSGEKRYLVDIINDAYDTASRLNHYVDMLGDDQARLAESKRLIGNISKGPRGKKRRAVLKDTGDLRYAMYLSYLLAKVDDLGLKHRHQERLLAYLKGHEALQAKLLEPGFIRAYAAQAANYVYWLYQLGVADLRADFDLAMQRAYPDARDEALSRQQFKNKIYGLTHIILADSGYYQRQVPAERHRWILDYFEAHRNDILARTSEDVMAEVALCLLLTGQQGHPLIGEVKQRLKASIHPEAGLIPSVSGKLELSSGEHRNVLAMALLNWPEQRFQGPDLGRRAKLPYGLVAK
ncbi:DUF3541 domain-containing protein [Gallaecimonas sp. GXIMD4217]|uniref:DUF3541 domain-containing protein n=1 Tax=Gallaecimonas sp. GXIMD4217 TaxID=3131927 RepID=UPI00311AC417